jgi:Tfp pilus assembly protein PilE
MINRAAGFTLIEVMTLILVLGLIIGIITPGFSNLLSNVRLETTARLMYGNFLKARQLTLSRHQEHGIFFDDINNKYYIIDKNDSFLEEINLDNGITYKEIAFGGDKKMHFGVMGTADNGHVVLKNSTGVEYKIIVAPATGRVRIEKD